MNQTKIAIVMPLAVRRGGAETLLMHLLRANRDAPRFEYTLAFQEPGPMRDEAEALGYSACVIESGQLRQIGRFVQTVRALGNWLYNERAEAVVSWQTKSHLYAGFAARKLRIPALWWQHGISHGHWMDKLGTRVPSAGVFCCSEQARDAQLAQGKCRARVIYPAVDLARFDAKSLPTPSHARAVLGLPDEGPIIGTVCRLQSQKGVHILLDAMAKVRQTHLTARLLVVGGEHPLEPQYAVDLRQQAAQAGLENQVIWAGAQADPALWVQAMDVFTLPSVGLEGFGMALVEAMALGKMVVASDAGGPREILTNGVNGWLVRAGSVDELANTLATALEPGPRAEAMRAAARLRAHEFGLARFNDTFAHEVTLALNGV